MGALMVFALVMAAHPASAETVYATDETYGKYYDFIISNPWYCESSQQFAGVEGGVLKMEVDLRFQKKNDPYAAYRFTGSGSETMTIEGRKYSATFVLEGFGFNMSSFGTGISIKTLTVTGGDRLPADWTWSNLSDIQLHLVQESNGDYSLNGYDNFSGGYITYECGGKPTNP
ncbi:MAG TPA: hypothetical protein VG839_05740 [Asticcacaulis sp.]|nr:hypothetical protein [Asticcacaulis sp.]